MPSQSWYSQYSDYLTDVKEINGDGDVSVFEGNIHELFCTLMENLSNFSIVPFENKAIINITSTNNIIYMLFS